MRTTQEYFDMTKEELQEVRNEYGYTKEECMLLDEDARFYSDDVASADGCSWLRNQGYTIERVLQMTDGKIAVLAIL